MKITKLQKAAKVLAKIKELDDEIIQLDKIALKVADNDVDCSISLSIGKTESEKAVSVLDEDGSIAKETYTLTFESFLSPFSRYKKETKPENDTYAYNVSCSNVLGILGVLLYDKQTKRIKLIKQLEKMGFIQ